MNLQIDFVYYFLRDFVCLLGVSFCCFCYLISLSLQLYQRTDMKVKIYYAGVSDVSLCLAVLNSFA